MKPRTYTESAKSSLALRGAAGGGSHTTLSGERYSSSNLLRRLGPPAWWPQSLADGRIDRNVRGQAVGVGAGEVKAADRRRHQVGGHRVALSPDERPPAAGSPNRVQPAVRDRLQRLGHRDGDAVGGLVGRI